MTLAVREDLGGFQDLALDRRVKEDLGGMSNLRETVSDYEHGWPSRPLMVTH